MSACVLSVSAASPCLADMPPLGYLGPVPRPPTAKTTTTFVPPLGYVGPVPRAEQAVPVQLLSAQVIPDPVFDPSPLLKEAGQNGEEETLISAKEMRSDSETGVVSAIGKVEIVHRGHLLRADKVIYNQKTGVMRAEGNVALLTPSGEVQFADYQEITGDMKQAFARNVGILFPDNSRMAARRVVRYDERYAVAERAVYTACNVCHEDPDQEPLWQVSANTITHDNVRKRIYYHDAALNFAGVPVAYSPYLSSPDPTVKRLQGFLSPLPGVSPNIGEYIKVPYYFDIAPHIDATLAPTFSVNDKVQLSGQYRHRFERGNLVLDGSFTRTDLINDVGRDKGDQWRGHLFGASRFDIDNVWRAGAEVQYVSDKSYLPRYKISTIDQTTSRAFVEGFHGRHYAAANSYYFQDLRVGVGVSEPIVFPSAAFSLLGDPGETLGGRWSLDGNVLVTARDNSGLPIAQQGPDTRRLSLNAGWQRQFISDIGLRAMLSGLVRTDSYWAHNVVSADKTRVYDRALFTRVFEQANAVVRYPLGRSGEGYQHIFEPIVALAVAPQVRTIAKQPLEDSLDVEFDETNLFSPNRFAGSDLIEGGSRVTYGFRNGIVGDNGARVDIFAGESYNFSENRVFAETSGISGHASDYVGRIDFFPVPWFNANYGFRLSREDLSPRRQDAYIAVGAPVFRPTARYIQAYQLDSTTNQHSQVRQITFGFSSAFAKYWTLSGAHTQAFDPQPGPRNSKIALTYVDECFAFGVNVAHDNTDRADISSGTSVAFHFYLKNLGGLHTDSTSNITFPAEFRQSGP